MTLTPKMRFPIDERMLLSWLPLLLTTLLCQIRDGRSQTETSELDVRLPPSIVEWSTSRVAYQEGSPVTLPCAARGHPLPEWYTWYKDGVVHSVLPAGVRGAPLTTTQEGYYQCSVTTPHGTAVSDVIRVLKAYLRTPHKQTVQKSVTIGTSVLLDCDVTDSVPVPQTTWQLHHSAHSTYKEELTQFTPRLFIDGTNRLFFAHIEAGDEEFYSCQGFNQEIGRSGHGIITHVKPTPGAQNDYIKIREIVVSREEKNIRLDCLVEAKPTAEVTWLYNDGPLPAGAKSTLGGAVLRVPNSFARGRFTCEAKNSAGVDKQTKQVELEVLVEPKFITRDSMPTNQNVTEGGTAEFHCKTEATPKAKVTWYLNAKPLIEHKRYVVSEDGLTLRMRQVCKTCASGVSDLSIISCNASNSAGYAFSSAYLNVLETTRITTPPVNQTLSHDVITTFHCDVTSDDSTPVTVTWFLDGELIKNRPDRLWIDDNSTDLHVLVRNDTQEEADEVVNKALKCVANNTYTTSSATAVLFPPAEGGTSQPFTKTNGDWWLWVVIVIVLLLLLLLLLLIIYCCCYRNDGKSYDVDKKEREFGRNPKSDYDTLLYKDYQRQSSSKV